MQFDTLLLEQVEPGIARITLNRPERRNCLNGQVASELKRALDEVNADESVRVAILAGAGPSFCGGADLDAMSHMKTYFDMEKLAKLFYDAFITIEMLRQPVIAAIQGHCIGAGHEMALSCDFSVAADNAQFSYPEIDFAIPSVFQAALLTKYAPLGLVREFMYTGDTIDACTAREWGLVNRVVPLERLEGEVLAAARKIASKSPLAVRLQKALMNRKWLRADLDTAIYEGINAVSIPFTTGEPQQKMAAFLEAKRRAKSASAG